MRTLSPALEAYLAQPFQTNARCLKITMRKHQPEIESIARGNPTIIETKWAHGWATSYTVQLALIKGMTNLNFQEYVITVIDATHFSVPVDSSAFPVYVNGGVARRIIGFTTYLRGFTFEGVRYNASKAYIPSAVRAVSDFSVSNFNMLGLLSSEAIKSIDIERGLYENAKLNFFLVNYRDLTMGKIELPGGAGNLGQVVLKKIQYEAEFKAKESFLQQDVGYVYSMVCRAELGYRPEHRFSQSGYGESTDDINFCYVPIQPPRWQATTAYEATIPKDASIGSVVRPSSYSLGRHFKCTVAGTSGASEPAWNATIGATTLDGSVTWTAIDAWTKRSSVSQVLDSKFLFVDYAREEEDHWYRYGKLTWLTGQNLGMKYEIKNFRGMQYPIVSVTTSTKTFRISGDKTFWFLPGQSMTVLGSSGNDTEFDIVAILAPEKKKDLSSKVQILGDRTARFPGGTAFTITGSPLNDGSYVVDNSKYDSSVGVTTIKVTTEFANGDPAGSILLPYTIVSATYNSGTARTEIVVLEPVVNGTADGAIYHRPQTFEFFRDTPFDIKPGDQYEMVVGCDKRAETCRDKFDNLYNARLERFVPGQDKYFSTPDAKA